MLRGVITHIYHNYGLAGAGLIFYLEGIGVPIPVEIPLGIIGLRMARGLNTYWDAVMMMWLATVAGNTTGYIMGYYGGRPLALRLLAWFKVKPEFWIKVESWFHKHGLKAVVATRWINWGFAQNMWLCGITRVPWGRFFTVMVINDLLWAMAWTWVARTAMIYLRRSFEIIHDSLLKFSLIGLTVVLIGVAIWWGHKRYRNR
jgi:membrane protein DedA with SNARE-associated domain